MKTGAFKPDQRIREKRVFDALFKRGKFAKGRILRLWSYQGPEIAKTRTPKLAIMVSRKTHKRATRRNLWKRRIREAFRRHQSRLKKPIGILVQSAWIEKVPTYSEIEAELNKLLMRTKSFQKDENPAD